MCSKIQSVLGGVVFHDEDLEVGDEYNILQVHAPNLETCT
jgi:hypothetical protein